MLELEQCSELTYAEIYDDERLAQDDGSLMFEMRDVIVRQEQELKDANLVQGLEDIFEAILAGNMDDFVECPVTANTMRINEDSYNMSIDYDKAAFVYMTPRDVITWLLAKATLSQS